MCCSLCWEEVFQKGDRLQTKVSCCQRPLQAVKFFPSHSVLPLQRLSEAFIVLHLEYAQEGDQENGMLEAVVTKSRIDTRHFFDQRHNIEGRRAHVCHTVGSIGASLVRLFMNLHFTPQWS